MYYETIQQFHKVLGNLDQILVKTIRHAEQKNFDVNNFVGLRLAPDMFPLSRQIQIATDVAKLTAATLAGTEPPKYEDNETTINQLRDRILKTRNYLADFGIQDFAHAASQRAKMPHQPGKAMRAQDYVLQRAIPNFYFHVTTTYSLLRMGGVDIGKGDFLGELSTIDIRM